MSSTATATPSPTASNSADARSGQTAGQFASSLVAGIVLFAVQVLVFLLIKDRFARIYQPKTYLVPARDRTKPIAPGWWAWIKPVLSTSNSEFIQKCGLDAYFFLRYLRMLLKIFVPAALIIMPILIPLNAVGGKGADWTIPDSDTNGRSTGVTGLDQLAWGNVRPTHTGRYWAHWLLALFLIIYVCYVSFDELKNYVRMRQAYITSPQHRLRASATTVLVGSIPEKWLSFEALDGLFDVFPGGVRNIWLNRNYDELSAKVSRRDYLARSLESAETELIKRCFKKHQEQTLKDEKAAGKKRTKEEQQRQSAMLDAKGQQQAQGKGMDSGNPHQVEHTVEDVLGPDAGHHNDVSSVDENKNTNTRKQPTNVPFISEGLHVIGQGFNQIGKGIVGGIRDANQRVNRELDTTNGFVTRSDHHAATDGNGRSGYEQEHHNPTMAPGTSNIAHDNHVSAAQDASPTTLRDFDGSLDQSRIGTHGDNDQLPLTDVEARERQEKEEDPASPNQQSSPTKFQKLKRMIGIGSGDQNKEKKEKEEPREYPEAFKKEFEGDSEGAVWKKYLTQKDRDTMRLPIFGWQWMFSLPWVGRKVDTIYYCREEVARLNVEIEDDQAHPERFPLMNSAFIQFNHQVAAHMACQSVSHHLPKQMAPRIVEIDPNDVIWDNMSIPWWQVYVRTAGIVTVVVGMILLWAVPVGFTSALSQISTAADRYKFLSFLLKAPPKLLSILQGILPPALLALLLFLLPVTLRFLSRLQGMQSGVLVELSVQKYYFFFLFVQIFLVVTVAGSLFDLFGLLESAESVSRIPSVLGQSIPKASNYFFSYMLLQAFSVSAGALVQVGGLVGWFILAPLFDSTARAKFTRQTQLSDIQWGTFFPVYTNLACIGLIYAVVSPLILVFNVITFTLFWFVYRYQTLYVTRFTLDTGGLLFPNAINTTFVGVYVMELALVGLFFLVQNEHGDLAARGQGIGMIVIIVLTAGYHYLLNEAFRPLFRYIPITLEDDAVRRDEEFARAMRIRHGEYVEEEDEEEIEDKLKEQERSSLEEDRQAHEYELTQIDGAKKRRSQQQADYDEKNVEFQNPEVFQDVDKQHKSIALLRRTTKRTANATINKLPESLGIPQQPRRHRGSWADRDHPRNRRSSALNVDSHSSHDRGRTGSSSSSAIDHRRRSPPRQVLDKINNFNPIAGDAKDLEAQQEARNKLADALFSGLHDELEDLTPEQRDSLVQRAFTHAALRARRPVIWIPRDDLGVSDDEIGRMASYSKNLWVSNVRQGLDAKGRAVYSGAPPDFSEIDIMRL